MDILKSLDDITGGYAVFEKNQVLTHDQLNSISGYLDDQSRLGRIKLLGVGVVCGLRAVLQGNRITLGRGVGITSDGDLLHVAANTDYNRFVRYDETKPVYSPFYTAPTVTEGRSGAMIPVYELFAAADTTTAVALPLDRFTAETGRNLVDMAALLFMESYITDRDICSGTDCDNLGQDMINNVKLMLVEKKDLGPLRCPAVTPGDVFSDLDEIVPDRPLFGSTIDSTNKLAQAYRTSCGLIQAKIVAELGSFYNKCASFLENDFSADPSPDWLGRLAAIKTKFDHNDEGIQYYYDFLKDLAETYNDFRDLLFNDTTLCSPHPGLFPKHLLLGNLAPGANPDENRTPFYASPALSRSSGQLQHAKFLLNKIDTLIRTFMLPSATGAVVVCITPGRSEEKPLEDRAIPCYYQPDAATPVHRTWSFRLHQRGMDDRNHSCNAAAYGGPSTPLKAQIGKYPFFRIEGHLGRNAHDAFTAIEAQISACNLPFAVHAVLLGKDHGKVIKKPGIRYTDLHRFHYLLRQDIVHQLDEVVTFSQNFKQKINGEVRKNTITETEQRGIELKSISKEHNTIIARNASTARGKLNGSYSAYSADTSWQQNLTPAMQSAGKFKTLLSDVVKTEFATPFDTLIGNTHIHWLGWLDDIIKARDTAENGKRLFAGFLAEHPGIEHYAGVVRGGTFVLVYDESQTVVADFMLPYYLPDVREEEPPEPPLRKPGFKPPWIVGNGITVLPSRDLHLKLNLEDFKLKNLGQLVKSDRLEEFVQTKFNDMKAEFKFEQVDRIQTIIQDKFDSQQKEYLNTMKDSVNLLGNALLAKRGAGVEAGVAGIYTDQGLNEKTAAARSSQQVLSYLLEKVAAQPELKDKYADVIAAAQSDLAAGVADTARYVAAKNMDVTMGSEGFSAMMEVNSCTQAIRGTSAFDKVKESFSALQKEGALSSGIKMILTNIVRK
jgi:hypothetical protein